MPIKFLYFDLGKVLLHFDHELAARKMAELAQIDWRRVWEIVFESGMQWRYEAGAVSSAEFHEEFCRESGRQVDCRRLMHAGAAMFWVNTSMKALVASLQAAGARTGVLSNTCEAHWEYCTDGRYAMLSDGFDVLALSHQIGAIKPDPTIYVAAAELAGVEPAEILFVDDRPENVEGALAAGYDAVLYTTTAAYAAELRRRSIAMNY
jgi:FMN phosphatase YigB (HAD superfamily)